MLKSIFKDGSVVYGVDYSQRKDCKKVVDISHEKFLEETNKVDIQPVQIPVELSEEEIVQKQEEEKMRKEDDDIQKVERLLLRKQALEFLGKKTKKIDAALEELKVVS